MAQVQNTVFSFSQESAECVLRLTPESHRSFEQIEAEIDWVRHLDQVGVPVSVPIANRNGEFCHHTEIDGKPWTATAFRRAPGKIGAESAWHQGTFRTWGQITARMHNAAAEYQPPHCPRRNWQSFLPSFPAETDEERIAQGKLAALVARIEALPTSRNDFGLIHSDLHFWNFAVDGEKLTIFDFDNCEHHGFMADLGTIIFESATCIHQRLARQEFIADFLIQFLSGYRGVREPGDSLLSLPDFAKLRETQIFLTLSRRWKDREIGPFQKAFFAATREAVLTDKAFVESSTMEAILKAARL